MSKINANWLLVATLGLGVGLELLLLASQWNTNYHKHGQTVGDWGIRLSHHQVSVLAWVVAILIAVAFIDAIGDSNWYGVSVLLVGTVLVELLFGHRLPNPQNNWTFAIAFTAGVVGTAVKIRSMKGVSNNLLGWVVSRPGGANAS